MFVALEDIRIDLAVEFGLDGVHKRLHFFLGGGQVAEIYGLAFCIEAQWIAGQVDIHCTGKCICNHQGWGCQVIGAGESVDPSFKVAIAGGDAGRDQVRSLHSFGNLRRERAGIANAASAAVPDQVETEFG